MGIFKGKAITGRGELAVVFTDSERKRVKALWRLTALPRHEFDATYGDMLSRFWRYVAAPAGEVWKTLKDQALTCAEAALRVRQARVLPRFGAAEDAARLHEVMSFALAAAVVAERFGLVAGRAWATCWCPLTQDVPGSVELDDGPALRSYGALLLPRLVGDAGLAWLGQEPVAMRELAAYFGEGASELRGIAVEAAARVGLPIADGVPAVDQASGEALVDGRKPDEESVDCVGTKNSEETRAEEMRPSETAKPDAVFPVGTREPIGGEGAGWRWINWVRAGLRDGSIPANDEGSWLHNIAGEAYVVVPDCFAAFAALQAVDAKTVRNQVVRLGRHRSRKSASGRANTFRAELADGRRVDGMAFPGELIWDDDPPLEAGGALGRRRR